MWDRQAYFLELAELFRGGRFLPGGSLKETLSWNGRRNTNLLILWSWMTELRLVSLVSDLSGSNPRVRVPPLRPDGSDYPPFFFCQSDGRMIKSGRPETCKS